MIDTGAAPNIIKVHKVKPGTKINANDIVSIIGVTAGSIDTLGSIKVDLLGRKTIFHLVQSNFPIIADGILGGDFIPVTANISYKENCLIWQEHRIPFSNVTFAALPPRSNTGIKLCIKNTEQKEGFIPRINLEPGIYVGNALLKNNKGHAYARIINTNDHEVEVKVPAITLEEYCYYGEWEKIPVNQGDPNVRASSVNTDDREKHNMPVTADSSALGSDKARGHKTLTSSVTKRDRVRTSSSRTRRQVHFASAFENSKPALGSGLVNSNLDVSELNSSIVTVSDETNKLALGSSLVFPNTHRKNTINVSSSTVSFNDTNKDCFTDSDVQSKDVYPLPSFSNVNNKSKSNHTISNVQSKDVYPLPSFSNVDNNASLYTISNVQGKDDYPLLSNHNVKRGVRTASTVSKGKIKNPNSTSASPQRDDAVRETLRLNHMNDLEKEHIQKLITKHAKLFHLPHEYLTMTNAVTHKIQTTDDIPVHVKQYRYPQVHKEEIDKQIDDLLKKNIIKPSSSPYNSPLWIVAKKADSKGQKRWRMVIDYRKLNEKSLADAYPLPNIVEVLDQLGSAKYFSVLDLASGFHQIGMDEKDAPKTAFSTPYGHYQFSRMPFGLKNGPATFQRLMDNVLSGLQGNELFVYLDDIVIYASSLEDHERKFNKLAERLEKANLKLQPDKCEFLRKEVTYLGHIIGSDGVRPDPAKVSAVRNFPIPQNTTNIKQFLGLAGYYRRFIANFSHITRPLTNLLKKDTPYTWEAKQQVAFDKIKEILCTEPLLQYPDFSKPFVLTTDASGYAVGGILSQGQIGEDLPIAYTSRVLNKAECNYSTTEKELLAIVYCVHHFRPYLYGRKFTLVTDHKPLIYIKNVKDPASRLARWKIQLENYEFEVVYKAGKKNVNADALSRNPVPERLALPLTYSSDEPIFDPPTPPAKRKYIPHSQRPSTSPVSPASSPIHAPSPPRPSTSTVSPPTSPIFPISDDDMPSDFGDGNDTETETTDEPIFDVTPPFHIKEPMLVETKDKITMRSDNLAFFITLKGEPCDAGSKEVFSSRKLPTLDDLMLGRAKVIRVGNRFFIALVVKEDSSVTVDKEILRETAASLLDVANELQLETISIARTFLTGIDWPEIKNIFKTKFTASQTKLIICNGEITIPDLIKRQFIIKENHESAIGGHKGVTKTYMRIREKYFWPRMKIDIQQFIAKCDSCQINKLSRLKTRQPLILTDTPGKAFDKVALDIVGPLPPTPSGNAYILTMQDLLTKYSLAIPLQGITAVEVADAFINYFICRFGAPKAILTDQGSNFTSSLMRSVSRKFKITQCKTTAFHPQSNGSLERSHHVLIEYLKHYIENNNWDEWLPLATFSYNTSVHEGTRHTPHELVFGEAARVPTSAEIEIDTQEQTYIDYLFDLQNKLQSLQENAKLNLEQAKIKTKHYYDRKTRAKEFHCGDYVYLLKEPRKGKFDAQYSGPYRVIENLGNHNFKIKIKSGSKVVHSNKLKPARGYDD